MLYLPSYSPELNTDELLNADLKEKVNEVAPARTKLALTRTGVSILRSIQKQSGKVEPCFEHKHVC